MNPACHSLIFWYTLVLIDTVNCTEIFHTKQCLYSVRILVHGYAPILHHTCIEDAKQLMRAFNHAPVSIDTTILLRAVIWNSWYFRSFLWDWLAPVLIHYGIASDCTLWISYHTLVSIDTIIRNVTYLKPLAYLSCICRADKPWYWRVQVDRGWMCSLYASIGTRMQ